MSEAGRKGSLGGGRIRSGGSWRMRCVGTSQPLSNLFVFFDQAVSNRDDAMRPSRYVVLVRDENDGVAFFVKLLEEVHDVVTRRRVQRSGRFIREENRRMIHQRASDRDALTLAA